MKPSNDYDKITLVSKRALTSDNNLEYDNIFNSYGELVQRKYKGVGLSIFIDYVKDITKITFSSKVLGGDAPRLINVETIGDAHRTVSKVVDISYADFIQATVLKAEVTKDIYHPKPEELVEALFKLAQLQTAYKIPRRFYKSRGKACSFWMKKNNTNKKYIDFLSIYDKYAEFFKQDTTANQEMYRTLTPEEAKQYLRKLEGIIRFEVKLNSAYMMRKHLELAISTTPTLSILLESEVRVVKNMVDRIFTPLADKKGKEYKPKNMTQLSYYLALKENDFDVEKTIAFLKQSLGEVKKSRIEKKLAAVMLGVALMQYSGIVLLYSRIVESL